MADYLLKRFTCREFSDLERVCEGNQARKVSSELKKLTVVTTHLAKNRMFVCDGLDSMKARDRTFEMETRDENGTIIKKQIVSVVEYMRQKYHLDIRCGYIPCVVQNKKDRDGRQVQSFFPMDVLKIVDGQRVSLQKMDARFVSFLIFTLIESIK